MFKTAGALYSRNRFKNMFKTAGALYSRNQLKPYVENSMGAVLQKSIQK